MPTDPDQQQLLLEILDAHDALAHPTAISQEIIRRIKAGQLEVLFDATMPPLGGLTPGENPVILGAKGVLGSPQRNPDLIRGLMLSTVHEGVHHLDIVAGRCSPPPSVTVEERFFTELHAYTAEYELATANGITHLQHSELWGARGLDDIVNAVLTIEAHLVPGLSRQPGLEQAVIQRVRAIFPHLT